MAAHDPYKRLGIEHLSPSSLNLWHSAPGLWGLRYLAKVKSDGNAAMWRGSAVENGLAAFLRGANEHDAQCIALNGFELNCQGEITDAIEEELALIAPMMQQCFLWEPPSTLNAAQLRVEHWFDGISIPVIGYLDFAFEGIDVDLKTTKACPSKPRADHTRQVALYRAARGRRGALLYVTDKRKAYFEIEDDVAANALSDLEADARSLQQFLARMDGIEDALRCLPIDYTHYAAPKTRVSIDQLLMRRDPTASGFEAVEVLPSLKELLG